MKKVLIFIVATVLVCVCALSLVACGEKGEDVNLTFMMPDGTPALAGASFLDENVSVAGANGTNYVVNGSIIAPATVQTMIAGEQADAIICPTNAGAMLIKNGAPYKLVAVAVVGSLYIIGKPDATKPEGEQNTITLEDLKGKRIASIGQGNTPDKVFRYIIDSAQNISYDDFTVEFVADGPAAKVAMMRDNDPCDYALLGEPAVTAFGTPAGGGYSARLDLQQLWYDVCGFEYNFPQASLFVKTKYANDSVFVENLLAKLQANIDWVKANPSEVTQYMQAKGSTTAFPAPSIPRCGVTVLRPDNQQLVDTISQYLELMTGKTGWSVIF